MYICVYIYICICMYIYVYIYIYLIRHRQIMSNYGGNLFIKLNRQNNNQIYLATTLHCCFEI